MTMNSDQADRKFKLDGMVDYGSTSGALDQVSVGGHNYKPVKGASTCKHKQTALSNTPGLGVREDDVASKFLAEFNEGLYANIHKKRKAGKKMRKKGAKGAPEEGAFERAAKTAKK